MLKKRTFFWAGIFLLMLVVGIRALFMYNKPHGSTEGEPPAVSIEAAALYQQYSNDEQKADRLYLGKIIEVKGTLFQVIKNGVTEIWILEGGKGGGINCQLFPGSKAGHPPTRPGMRVTIKGKCTGFLMDVNLADCVLP